MSSYINHFKKTAEQNAKDLQDIPKNWESMQDADQKEIDELNLIEFEMEQAKLEQIKQDNREPIEEESEERQYCISRADTL